MKVMIVDDEVRACHVLEIFLKKRADVSEISVFQSAAEALAYARKNEVDLAFLDIEMPEINGLKLALRLLDVDYVPAVVFVTGYAHYALDAWDTDAVDFIVKPFSAETVDRAIRKAKRVISERIRAHVDIRCFPVFRLIVDGETVLFHHKKSQELLAYLVHNRGAWVPSGSAAAVLFEDKEGDKSKNYFRLVLYRLKSALVEAGAEGILETEHGKIRVNPDKFTCDYYRCLEGEKGLFQGEYLSEYSWAEYALGYMQR